MNSSKSISVITVSERIRVVLLSAVLLLTVVAATAKEPWDGPAFSADPAAVIQAASAVAVEEGVDAVVLLEEEKYVFESDGRSVYTWRLIYRIMPPGGVQGWSMAQVLWEKWHQERPSMRARVITPDGAEHFLDSKTIGEFPANQNRLDIFDDMRVLRAPLPAITVGAVVEEEIIVTETAPLFDRGVVKFSTFGRTVPVLQSRLVIEASRSLPLRYVTRLLPSLKLRRSENSGQVRLIFESGALGPIESFEPFLPSDVPLVPYVAFSTGESWSDVAARYGQLVVAQIEAGPVKSVTPETINQSQSKKAIVAQLLARLHGNIRYTGVEFGEAAIIPRTPAETSKRKYGDCKVMATLLVAMLRSAGIDAHVVLLNTGPGLDVEKELPGFGVFNHTVVYVPGTPPLWIDPTDEFTRVGQLPIPDQGRLALITGPNTNDLIRIPEATSVDNRVVETREFFLANEGKARVVETTEGWGSIEPGYRRNYSQLGKKEIRELLETYAKGTYVAEAIANVEYSDPRDLSCPFQIRFEATGAQRGMTDVAEAAVAIFPAPLTERLPQYFTASESAPSAKRKTDLVLPGPFVTEWRYRIVPPPGFKPGPLPEGGLDRLGPTTLSKEFAVDDDDVVTAILRFDTTKRRFTPDEAEELRRGIAELQNAQPIMVTFEQTGEAHLAAGRIREALAEFRKLATLHPNKALHQTQIAQALLAGGMGEKAREVARRSNALQPKSAIGHLTLGQILEHDFVGRRFQKGSDLEGAATAYREAIRLEPSHTTAHAALAILFEHDAEGNRYGSHSKLDEAIKEYRSMGDELDVSSPIFYNFPVALMWARRFEELKNFIRKHESLPTLKPHFLVAVAATDGPNVALKEAAKLFPYEETRRAALMNVGNTLINLRHYPEAAALLNASAIGDPNAVALRARADMIRKAQRHEGLSLPESDPRSVVKRMFITLFLDRKIEDFLSLLTRESREEALKKKVEAVRVLRQVRSLFRRQEIPLEVVLDLMLVNVQMSVDGDESLGYRVRMQVALPTGNGDQLFFVVLEEGQHRILASDGDLSPIGREVLRRIEKGDLAGARQWLDWAREQQTLPGGDDPFTGPPFPWFWTKGSDAGLDEIRYAAASLIAGSDYAKRAIPILRKGKEHAGSGDARIKFNLALAGAFMRLDQPENVLPIARQLLEVRPDSLSAFRHLANSLRKLRRRDELKKVAEERLKRLPDDPGALRLLAELARRQENFEQAQRLFERLVEIGKAEAGDFNNRARQTLFENAVTDQPIEQAQRAVILTRNAAAGSLHTLASLYAEVGKTTEAREVILQAMEVEAMDEPEPHFWYVFGRIAEQYGELDAALDAYRKVEPPEHEEDIPDSTYRLVQRRLAVLQGNR